MTDAACILYKLYPGTPLSLLTSNHTIVIPPPVHPYKLTNTLCGVYPQAIIMYCCIRNIAANSNTVCGGIYNTYASAQPAALYKQCTAFIVFCLAFICPLLFAAPALPVLRVNINPVLVLTSVFAVRHPYHTRFLWHHCHHGFEPGRKYFNVVLHKSFIFVVQSGYANLLSAKQASGFALLFMA